MAAKNTKKEAIPNWHPDFRNVATLPDIKVVRTDFLVNFVALTVPIILLGLLVVNEIKIQNYKSDIESLQQSIQDESAKNNVNLKNSAAFGKEAKKVDDLKAFFGDGEDLLEVFTAITASRPENIALSSINCRRIEKQINKKKKAEVDSFVLKGVLKGSSSEALNALNEYREMLENLSVFKDKVDEIDISQRRNPQLDMIEFGLDITLKIKN